MTVTTTPSTTAELADVLWSAEQTGVPVQPLTARPDGLDVDQAYAVQAHNAARRIAAGATLRGRKIGLTSLAMQRQLGVDEPDFGVLLDDMFVEEGDAIDLSELIAPRVEAEIAFVLGRDLHGPGVTVAGALRAIDAALPALEIIDSRIADWRITLPDTVADNASSARVVLGGRLTSPHDVDLRLCGMAFAADGVVVEAGAGAAVLGNPARCVAWLANRLAGFGEHLHAGDVVLAGALHRAVPVDRAGGYQAQFDGLGSVTARFTDRGAA